MFSTAMGRFYSFRELRHKICPDHKLMFLSESWVRGCFCQLLHTRADTNLDKAITTLELAEWRVILLKHSVIMAAVDFTR
jgi:hypothetical protein